MWGKSRMGVIKNILKGTKIFREKNGIQFRSISERTTPFTYKEAFKDLRTNIEYITSVNNIKSLLITSAIPEESKSTVTINLAVSLVETKHSVVVVECDLRKPILAKYLKVDTRGCGLSEILLGKAKLADCIKGIDELGISIIPAGASVYNPSELLNQEKMKRLITYLSCKFDYVILDGPPVTVVTDATVVGRMVDGALLVVRSRYAPTKTIQLAKQKLEAVDIKVLGAVLTRYDAKRWGWRSGYDYATYEKDYSAKKR